MKRVLLTAKAEVQLAMAYDWYARQDRRIAIRWYRRIIAHMKRIPKLMNTSALAGESDDFPVKMRQVLYGLGRAKTHRIVFVDRPEAVVVYAIRHLAQDELTPDDV